MPFSWIPIVILVIINLGCNTQIMDTPLITSEFYYSNTQTHYPAPRSTISETPFQIVTFESAKQFSSYLPAGILVLDRDNYGITLYNLAGIQITKIKIPPEYEYSHLSRAHLAGLISDQFDTPLVYLVMYSFSSTININIKDKISTISESHHPYSLSGAPGQNVLVITEVEYLPELEALNNKIYFGSIESLTASYTPIISVLNYENFAYVILSVKAKDEKPLGFFYTQIVDGVHGEFVFSPTYGLFYYDAIKASTSQILGNDRNPVGISRDMTWIASTTSLDNKDLRLHDLTTGTSINLSIENDSIWGAGFLVFSPDNRYVAWMEASGIRMKDEPDFTSLVKVATIKGEIILKLPLAEINKAINVNAMWTCNPVGFIDNENLLIELHTSYPDHPFIIKVNVQSGSIAWFSDGDFLNFYYQ